MCGRFTLKADPGAIAERFGRPEAPDLLPRFNVAPSQVVAVVRPDREGRRREFVSLRWGLIHSYINVQ